MVSYLTKSDASEGFNQVIDLLNRSYIKYALTLNPNIYVTCIKQFWNIVAIKQVNDVTRLQALVDKKKVVVTEAVIREKVFANMRRVGKGFSWVETPLFEGMLVGQEIEEGGDEEEHVEDVTIGDAAQGDDTAAHGEVPTVQHTPPQSPQAQPQPQPQLQQAADFPMSLFQEALDACDALTRRVEHLEYDKVAQALEITKLKRRVKKLEKGNRVRVLKLRRLKGVGTSQRIDTSDDTMMDDESNQGRTLDEMDKDDVVALIDDKEEDKKDEEVKVVKNDQVQGRQAESQAEIYKIDMDHALKVLSMNETVTAASAIILVAEPQVPIATITAGPTRVAAAPKEPKPLKKKQQIEMDEVYARKLHAELNKDIDLDVAIDHVKLKAKEDPVVKRYQAMKRKPQTEAQARKNMIMYLKNVVCFRALQRINETPAERATKRRKLDEEVGDLKIHLKIVPDEDDDVYTEATPLARKVPVVDYKIIRLNNKPYYKIIRADGTHQLYISFLTLLKNFDREDLEALWNLVKEMFSTSKLKNFSDDFLLTTLGAMFEKPDAHAQV
uniref:Xylulose kinase-1 n=1 Tax=Tanacetum cinerariifolium TaxID=118510 RepID=A0A6L2LLR1_TANCI|nr:hypothetical protein [Tanacetum cinerariifolium]